MSVAKAISGNPQRTRGNMTIFTGGVSSSGQTQVTEMVTHASSAYHQGSQNGLPVVSSTKGNAKCVSGGAYTYFLKGHWVMLANAITTQLGGISTNILKNGSAHVFRRQFARKTTYRTHFTSKIEWDATTGSLSGPAYTYTKSNQTISFQDDASLFNQNENGELTYLNGSKNPILGGYQGVKLW